jgi:hypothetical protein
VLDEFLGALLEDLREYGVLVISERFIDGTFVSAKKGEDRWERPNGEKVRSSWRWLTPRLLEWIYCNPYCNRAGTHWYAMDKPMPPDHRKPPKRARFPDAVGHNRTCASQLLMSRGKRFESARRFFRPKPGLLATVVRWMPFYLST